MTARHKEFVFWASVALFYASGGLAAMSIYWRSGLLPVVAAATWWAVTLFGMHAMHEVHANAPILGITEERFKKPDVPQR